MSPEPVGVLYAIVAFGVLFCALAALGQGLSTTLPAFFGPLRQHGQLTVFALIGNFVILPALVIGMLRVLNLGTQANMGLLLAACAAGAPFVAWMVSVGKGNIAYGASLALLLIVGTLILLPLTLPAYLSWLKTGYHPGIWHLYRPMLLCIGVPLVIGLIVRARHPGFAKQVATWLGPLSIAFLLVHISLFWTLYWNLFEKLNAGQWAFMLGITLAGLLIGWVLAPPYALSAIKPANPHYGTKLASEVGTGQKGTQAVILTCLFTLSAYPTACMIALIQALVGIVVVTVFSLERGKLHGKKLASVPRAAAGPSSNGTPAAQTTPANTTVGS